MKSIKVLIFLGILYCFTGIYVQAQNAEECAAGGPVDSNYLGSVFFNYGSVTNALSIKHNMTLSLGESFVGMGTGPVIGPVTALDSVVGPSISIMGFYARFLLSPFPPIVRATQGDLLDRIQVSWETDPLGPDPNEGFNVYRDGVYLATVAANIRNYNDFNVISGRPYNYTVAGLNMFGEGPSGSALGFQVPNGVVTGWVQTINGSPVPDALVALTPMQGFSAVFDTTAGAFAMADTISGGDSTFIPAAGGDWSMTFWIKTDLATAGAALMEFEPYSFYLHALESAGGDEGISVSTSADGSTPFLTGVFPHVPGVTDSTKNDWHHVAFTVDGDADQARLYIDGILADRKEMALTIPSATVLNIGDRTDSPGDWIGRLDELRIYHRRLDELDFGEIMMGTGSSLTPDLAYYWKMDEEQGYKSFDLIRRNKLFFCGATFDPDRPHVRTAGMTNEDGYYRIESASYGTGTTFLAEPMKSFYMHRALKFVRDEADYATLPDFSLTNEATLELWVNSAGPDGTQCLLSKKWGANDFRLMLEPNGLMNELKFYLTGDILNLGDLGMGYQHLAFTIDSLSGTVTAFKNGTQIGSKVFPGLSGNWSDTIPSKWYVGARPSGGGQTDHFGGLIDEIAVYDTTLSTSTVEEHFMDSRDMQEKGLRIYYPFDEGNGNGLNNSGPVLAGAGMTFGTEWTPFAANQKTEAHVFSPSTRQVTLNPSVTSVDQIDFTDRSTVAVTGFARYAGTDCFAENVEILVNGESFFPAVFTDSTGKFIIDFDPGTSAILTPKFEVELDDTTILHTFVPAFWEVTNVVNPIAGILFTNTTKRKIEGQVLGGDENCNKSITGEPNTVCIINVRSLDGCLDRFYTVNNFDGSYKFEGLPPIEYTVAVTEHSNPTRKAAFQVQGGITVNLEAADSTVNFRYFAQPDVAITAGLDSFSKCDIILLDQYQLVSLLIQLQERYDTIYDPNPMSNAVLDDGVCPVDTANIKLLNGFADEAGDSTMTSGTLKYNFRVGAPNPSPPYLKTLQIIGTTQSNNENSLVVQAVITGVYQKDQTFTTLLPEMPTAILRDPPGDGSYSYLEAGTETCHTTSASFEFEVGGGLDVHFLLGPKVKTVTGLTLINETNQNAGIDVSALLTYKKVTDNSMETCLSIDSRVATSDSDLIIGGTQGVEAWGADLYMGVATNIIFGMADMVSYNDTTCSVDVKEVLSIEPGDFSTTFVYSNWYLNNYVLRYIDSLITSPNTNSTDSLRLIESKMVWDTVFQRDTLLREMAKFQRNISFDAGISYEYSETSDTTKTNSTEEFFNSEGGISIESGLTFDNVGVNATLKFVFNTSDGDKNEDGISNGLTTGYVLEDDDPGDAFTVDVLMDTFYKTPVFNLKSGQSACPWEAGTARREGANLQIGATGQVATDVPSHEPAVFNFTLGNLSKTNEDWIYGLRVAPESNPHGAVVAVNGSNLNNVPVFYTIPNGTSVPITVTVNRGPVEYDYDDLEIALYSECEMERANALAIVPNTLDSGFYSYLNIGAHFIEPCSEVDIQVPEQNWVIHKSTSDTLRITVSGYDKFQEQFDLIRVQYRRTDGPGAWINIGPAAVSEIQRENLGATFSQFFWDTEGLSDGPYEIHAWAVCTDDAVEAPGFSQVIKGRIDREPPSIVGTPEPSDGVYHVGDEISFTFNKHINCDNNKLIQATGPPNVNNNVGLYDTQTNTLIDIQVTCFENKIIIDPTFQNEFYENHILRVQLDSIEDLTGNVFLGGPPFNNGKWEFYVDRNELAWLTDKVEMTKYEDETKTVIAKIHNRGGYPVPFSIRNVPDWVHVFPDTGVIVANEIRDIRFEVDSSLAFGLWSDSIMLHTITGQNPFFMGGVEGVPFCARVICRPPDWEIDAGIYLNTMNMVLEVDVQGELSTDEEDIVAAYVGDELRGRAHVQYLPQVDKYLAYLTIYGDSTDKLKPVRLEVWDASACLRYGEIQEAFDFLPDVVVGFPSTPERIHTNSLVLREIPLGFGWNWVSFNLTFPDNSLNAALGSLSHPANDFIRSQTDFSMYNAGSWVGGVTGLENTTMYVYKTDLPDTIKMLGNLIDPLTTNIPIASGWNWIGYIPNYALPINDALSTLSADPGDLIKSQLAFAQYLNSTHGWVGNLLYMQPPRGYQIKLTNAGTLTYPIKPFTDDQSESRGATDQPISSYWTVDPAQYEFGMTLIGALEANGENVTTSTMELGVFAGNEVRGAATAIYIASIDAYQFFLTSYANTNGELLNFKLYDSATGEVQELAENMYFSSDLHQGTIQEPVPFSLPLSSTGAAKFVQVFDIQPNPFSTETTIRFTLPSAQNIDLIVYDVSGREVSGIHTQAPAGLNVLTWNGISNAGQHLSAGVYFVRLQTEWGSVSKRVILNR